MPAEPVTSHTTQVRHRDKSRPSEGRHLSAAANLALLPVAIRVHLVHASLFSLFRTAVRAGFLQGRLCAWSGSVACRENSQPFPPCGVAKASAPFRSHVWHKPNSHLGDSFRTPGVATWNSTLSRKRVFPLSGAKRASLYCRAVVASELTFGRGAPISLDCSRVEWERRAKRACVRLLCLTPRTAH